MNSTFDSKLSYLSDGKITSTLLKKAIKNSTEDINNIRKALNYNEKKVINMWKRIVYNLKIWKKVL